MKRVLILLVFMIPLCAQAQFCGSIDLTQIDRECLISTITSVDPSTYNETQYADAGAVSLYEGPCGPMIIFATTHGHLFLSNSSEITFVYEADMPVVFPTGFVFDGCGPTYAITSANEDSESLLFVEVYEILKGLGCSPKP